jgi:hypothetical protein
MREDCTEKTQTELALQSNSYHCPSADFNLNWDRRLGYFQDGHNETDFSVWYQGQALPNTRPFFSCI